jgi:hypothetical protein
MPTDERNRDRRLKTPTLTTTDLFGVQVADVSDHVESAFKRRNACLIKAHRNSSEAKPDLTQIRNKRALKTNEYVLSHLLV